MTINRDLPLVAPYVDVEPNRQGDLIVTETDLPHGSGFLNGARVSVAPVSAPGGATAGPYVTLEDHASGQRITGTPVGSVGTLTRYQVIGDVPSS